MSGTCAFETCCKPAKRRGWCRMHYQRWIRHGDPARGRVTDQGRLAAALLCEQIAPPDGARFIPLTKGLVAIVDEADYPALSMFRWGAQTTGRGPIYASRHEPQKDGVPGAVVLMHRQILGAPEGVNVDHRNRNGLDNRRENLRAAYQDRNALNHSGHRDRLSMYKGVWPHSQNPSWCASFRGKYIGSYRSEKDAALAYDAVAYRADPEFSHINFPEELQCQAS